MALDFNASGRYASFGSDTSLDNLQTWSFACWAYINSWSAYCCIFDKWDDPGNDGLRQLALGNTTPGNLYAVVRRNPSADILLASTAAGIPVGSWFYLAVTYDMNAVSGSRFLVYRGSLTTSAAYITSGGAGSGSLRDESAGAFLVGNDHNKSAYALPGKIACVANWNSVLTLADIKRQQFQWSYPVNFSNCVLFSHLGLQGTGTQADWSGNGNNGTITGATLAPHVPVPFPAVFPQSPYELACVTTVVDTIVNTQTVTETVVVLE